MITNSEKNIFLDVCYESIKNHFLKKPISLELNEKLKECPMAKMSNGVFITLILNNKLRGCIGCIETNDPLYKTLPYFSIQSAFHDHRFKPLNQNEFKKIKIEISILTKPKLIQDKTTITLGKHGLIFEYDKFRSVFLPEVPIEQKWDLKTTFIQLEHKAGAPINSWKSAHYLIFESIKF